MIIAKAIHVGQTADPESLQIEVHCIATEFGQSVSETIDIFVPFTPESYAAQVRAKAVVLAAGSFSVTVDPADILMFGGIDAPPV